MSNTYAPVWFIKFEDVSQFQQNVFFIISFKSRLRKNYINFQVQGYFVYRCKILRGCLLITLKKIDGGGKLIYIMQFQGGNRSFVNVRRIIGETYNFKG